MIKKMTLVNLRIDDQLLDEIEKIAIEKFDDNTSEAIRFVAKLGIKFHAIKPHEMDQEKLEEITKEMDQKIKDETIFEWFNSKTDQQLSGLKNWIELQQEERTKKEKQLFNN